MLVNNILQQSLKHHLIINKAVLLVTSKLFIYVWRMNMKEKQTWNFIISYMQKWFHKFSNSFIQYVRRENMCVIKYILDCYISFAFSKLLQCFFSILFQTHHVPVSLSFFLTGWWWWHYSARCYFGCIYDRRCRVGNLRGSTVALWRVVS